MSEEQLVSLFEAVRDHGFGIWVYDCTHLPPPAGTRTHKGRPVALYRLADLRTAQERHLAERQQRPAKGFAGIQKRRWAKN